MLDVNRDPGFPPSSAKTTDVIRRLERTGLPLVLTINGESELVVRDPVSYQKLLELAERVEDLEITRRSLAQAEAGDVQPASEMLAEMRRILDEKRSR